VSTDDRKIKFYDMHTWEVVMEVELQNPALCLCSWKHLDTEMFGACSSILFHLVSILVRKSSDHHLCCRLLVVVSVGGFVSSNLRVKYKNE